MRGASRSEGGWGYFSYLRGMNREKNCERARMRVCCSGYGILTFLIRCVVVDRHWRDGGCGVEFAEAEAEDVCGCIGEGRGGGACGFGDAGRRSGVQF